MYESLKKLVSIIMAISMIFVQVAVASAQTLGQEGMNEEIVYQETYYDEDGDLVTQTIKKITYPSTRAGENERVTYVNEKSYVDFTAAFYATFSYNIQNKEVSCVSKYITYENKDSNKKFIPDKEVWSDTGRGTKCTVKVKFYFMDGFNNKTLGIECDYKGNYKLIRQ